MMRNISEGGEPEELIEPLKGEAVTKFGSKPQARIYLCACKACYELIRNGVRSCAGMYIKFSGTVVIAHGMLVN